MKTKSREINVFSVSALDLFASALGAFIVMSMIFMVFFTMTSQGADRTEDLQATLDACEDAHAQAEEALAQCENRLEQSVDAAALDRCQTALEDAQNGLDAVGTELESCRRALKKTFVLVLASWSSEGDDVDLHVVDPQGREFYFDDKRHPPSSAVFEEDSEIGPGNEIWRHPNAEPGRYRVCYKFFELRNSEDDPVVRGSVYWQGDKIDIPNVRLTREKEVRLAVEFEVDGDGNVVLDRSSSGRFLGTEMCA